MHPQRNPLVNRTAEAAFALPPFLDPDLQVSQRLVPILMSEETLAFGMGRQNSTMERAQNLLDGSSDGQPEIDDFATANIDGASDQDSSPHNEVMSSFSLIKEHPY